MYPSLIFLVSQFILKLTVESPASENHCFECGLGAKFSMWKKICRKKTVPLPWNEPNVILIFLYSFPPTKRKKWESLFPSCTKKDELGLVDSLIRYDPKKRASAKEVGLQ